MGWDDSSGGTGEGDAAAGREEGYYTDVNNPEGSATLSCVLGSGR